MVLILYQPWFYIKSLNDADNPTNLIIGLITVGQAQVVVEALDVQVGEDELVLDHLPDDPGHLVTVHLDDRLVDLDALAGGVLSGNESVKFAILERYGSSL